MSVGKQLTIETMSKSWNNFVLVIVLALLQGFAPLLHAHVHDISQPGKIHFHAFEFDAPQAPVDAGVSHLKSHLADADAIGVESAGKTDRDLFVLDDSAYTLQAAPYVSPFAQAPPALLFTVLFSFIPSVVHLLPPAQAPPGAFLS